MQHAERLLRRQAADLAFVERLQRRGPRAMPAGPAVSVSPATRISSVSSEALLSRAVADVGKQPRHFDGGVGGFTALVRRSRRGALERFLRGIGRQHAERHRHAGARRRRGDAVRAGRGDVFEVRRRAPDQATEADHRVDPAGLGDALRRHRDLERARHAQHFDVALGDAGIAKRRLRADQQAVGDEIVEARDDDRYPHYLPLPDGLALFEERLGAFFHVGRRGDRAEQRRLEELARRERAVESLMHRFEDVAHRDRRLRREHVRDLLRFGSSAPPPARRD